MGSSKRSEPRHSTLLWPTAQASKTKFVRKVAKRGQTSCSEAAELLNFFRESEAKKIFVSKIEKCAQRFQNQVFGMTSGG